MCEYWRVWPQCQTVARSIGGELDGVGHNACRVPSAVGASMGLAEKPLAQRLSMVGGMNRGWAKPAVSLLQGTVGGVVGGGAH